MRPTRIQLIIIHTCTMPSPTSRHEATTFPANS